MSHKTTSLDAEQSDAVLKAADERKSNNRKEEINNAGDTVSITLKSQGSKEADDRMSKFLLSLGAKRVPSSSPNSPENSLVVQPMTDPVPNLPFLPRIKIKLKE